MATNFLNFCRTGSAIHVAFTVGAPGVGCATGKGNTLVVAYFGVGQWTFGALPLLPSHYSPHSIREGFLLLFSMAHILHIIVGHPAVPQDLLQVLPLIPSEAEAVVELLHPK